MNQYVGLDVSMEETAICVVDELGEIVAEKRVVITAPEIIAACLRNIAPGAVRVGLEGQIRGLLKTFGILFGPGKAGAFRKRSATLLEELSRNRPDLIPPLESQVALHSQACERIGALNRQVRRLAGSPNAETGRSVPIRSRRPMFC